MSELIGSGANGKTAYQPRVQPWERDAIDPGANGTTAYQPRVQPWEWNVGNGGVLKERRIGQALGGDALVCSIPSERGDGRAVVPRALPWAGMLGPFGARAHW